jgi:hypothetical protein
MQNLESPRYKIKHPFPTKKPLNSGSLSPRHHENANVPLLKRDPHAHQIASGLYNLCHNTCSNFYKKKNVKLKPCDNESLDIYFSKVIEKPSVEKNSRPIFVHHEKVSTSNKNELQLRQYMKEPTKPNTLFSSTNVDFFKTHFPYKRGTVPLRPLNDTNGPIVRPDTRYTKENMCSGLEIDYKTPRPSSSNRSGLPSLNSVSHKMESLMFSIDESLEQES